MAVFGTNIPLHDSQVVQGLWPVVPSSTTPAYVDLSGKQQVTILLVVSNTTGVAGSAITVKQATSSGGAGEKPVAFTTAWANEDVSSGTAFTETAVSNNTFTTTTASNVKCVYLVEIDVFKDIDVKGGFRYLRVGTGNSTNATVGAWYILQ